MEHNTRWLNIHPLDINIDGEMATPQQVYALLEVGTVLEVKNTRIYYDGYQYHIEPIISPLKGIVGVSWKTSIFSIMYNHLAWLGRNEDVKNISRT